MSCVKAPKVQLLDLPGISLLLPSLSFSTPDLSLGLCCNFEIPSIPVDPDIALQLIATALKVIMAVPGGAAVIAAIMSTINTAITDLNLLMDQLQFSCPLD